MCFLVESWGLKIHKKYEIKMEYTRQIMDGNYINHPKS